MINFEGNYTPYWAAFSRPRSQFFTIRTDPKPANNLFFSSRDKLTYKWIYATLSLNWPGLVAVVKNLTSERASNFDTRRKKM